MAEYVVCSSCGARIKATRQRCLRCLEPLHGDESPSYPSLSLSRVQTLALAGGVSLAVLALVVVLWWTRPQEADPVARPYSTPSSAQPRPDGLRAKPLHERPERVLEDVVAEDHQAALAAREVAGEAERLRDPARALLHPVGEPAAEVAAVADVRRPAGTALTGGNLESARASYEAVLEKKADDPEALNGLGLVLERSGKLDEAIARYAQAAQLVPDKWTYRFNLAHAEAQAQRWDRATADYREAVRLFPDDYATQYNLALALHNQGDDRAAIPEYEKAIQLAPSEPSFHLSLAMSLERLGKTSDAAREYQQYLQMNPSAPEAEKIRAHVQSLTATARM